MELDRDHVNSGCSTVLGEVDSVAANDEARAISVILFSVINNTHTPIHDVRELGDEDIIAGNEYDGIGAFADAGNTLGQATKSNGVQVAPKFLVL